MTTLPLACAVAAIGRLARPVAARAAEPLSTCLRDGDLVAVLVITISLRCVVRSHRPADQVTMPGNTMPLAADQATYTCAPTVGRRLPARLETCATTRSLAEIRTCKSIVAPMYETNYTMPGRELSTSLRGLASTKMRA